MKKVLYTLSAAAILSGCTNTAADCDPHQELSVFNKAACSMSGSYNERVEQKEKLLVNEQEVNRQFHEINDSINAQLASSNQSLAAKRAERAKMNRQLGALTAQLKQKAQGKKRVLAEIQGVEAQMRAVDSNPNASEMEKEEQLLKLKNRVNALEHMLDL